MSINYAPSLNHLNSCAVYYDPGNTRSYPGSGSAITTLVGSVSGLSILTAPAYSASNGGALVLGGASAGDGTITSTYPRGFPSNAVFAHTLEIVIKPTGTPAANECILLFGTSTANSHSLVRTTTNTLQVRSNNSAIIEYGLANSNWYHIVSTFDGTTVTLYVNGVRVNSSVSSPSITIKSIYLFGFTGFDSFEGSVGIIRMYNMCLSAEDVYSTFGAFRGRYGL